MTFAPGFAFITAAGVLRSVPDLGSGQDTLSVHHPAPHSSQSKLERARRRQIKTVLESKSRKMRRARLDCPSVQKRSCLARPSFRVSLLRGNKTYVCEEFNDCLQNEQLPWSETTANGFYEKQIPFVQQLLNGDGLWRTEPFVTNNGAAPPDNLASNDDVVDVDGRGRLT